MDDWLFWGCMAAFVIFLKAVLVGDLHLYVAAKNLIAHNFRDNDLYLLSAVVQSLAAIFAMVMTVSLMVIQLSFQTIGPTYETLTIVHLRNYKLWAAMLCSISAMMWNSIILARIQNLPASYSVKIDVGLLLALLSITLFVLYFLSTLNRLKVTTVIDILAERIR